MSAIQNLYVCTYLFKAHSSHVSQCKNGLGFAELCNMDQSLLNPKPALLNITGNPTLVVPNINVKPNASQTINCDVYGGWPTTGSTSQHEMPSSLCNTFDLEAQAQFASQSSGGMWRWHFDIQVLWNTIFMVVIKPNQSKSKVQYTLPYVHCVCHSANWNVHWKSSCLVFRRAMFLLKAANEKLFEGGNKALKAESRLNPSGATYCWVSVFTIISSSTLKRTPAL